MRATTPTSSVKRPLLLASVVGGALLLGPGAFFALSRPEHGATSPSPAGDPVAALQAQVDSGAVTLRRDPVHGYLPAVLSALKVPTTSQMLVFSKTSFQRQRISPNAPRALYFNDQSYIGWVQGGPVLEVAAIDPRTGPVFYTLDQNEPTKPRFRKQSNECLSCHNSLLTHNSPGLVMRSVYPGRDGEPIVAAGSYQTTDQSPMKERWGGWYVTGTHGSQFHLGNLTAGNVEEVKHLDLSAGANVTDLRDRLDTHRYLTRDSDIVALLVLAHQVEIENLITRTANDVRIAQAEAAGLSGVVGSVSGENEKRIQMAVEPLVRAMLFVGEAPLTEPVRGTSGFAEGFAAGGPRDHQHRSLRELDLRTRLLRYPCSYLIYSPAFDALPDVARKQVYRRFREILTGKDQSPDFRHLSANDRTAIREILTDTRPEFAGAG